MTLFRAMIVEEGPEKTFNRRIGERNIEELPDGDVLIKVHYSSLNYKDGLSANGNRGVTRNYPHTPGVDAAGTVVADDGDDEAPFSNGDKVVVIGYDLGMNTAGGYGQYIRVPAGWVAKLPEGLTLRDSMIYGTAGFTAAQSVIVLEYAGVKPDDGKIVVTGATGGVGSIAIAILAKLGYTVVAATGKLDESDYLTKLGAAEVIDRAEINDESGRPMLRTSWAGAIDTVGGNPLATLLKTVKYGGAVTTCGMVAGTDFSSSVFPFILRGVSLLGIDSVTCPFSERLAVWSELADRLHVGVLETIVNEVSLDQVSDEIDVIMKGKQRGRVVVNLWA